MTVALGILALVIVLIAIILNSALNEATLNDKVRYKELMDGSSNSWERVIDLEREGRRTDAIFLIRCDCLL